MDKKVNLKSQQKEIHEWMRDAADVSYEHETLDSLIEDCNDCYEVTLHVYLKNSQTPIILSNRCTDGYLRDNIICDEIILYDEGFEFNKFDKNYSTGFIPYSNISYIETVSHTDVWKSEELRKAYEERVAKHKDNAEQKEIKPAIKKISKIAQTQEKENPHFNFVYCRGTKDGKGVIEALEAHGGENVYSHDGTNSCYDYTFYIDPDGEIIAFVPDQDVDRFILIKQFYTEIPPLTNET